MIKSIETHYNGYRFRSRLEARWAVFFDNMGIKYEYEPEGFDLGNGIYYLPDFWLPQVKMYAEVKPEVFNPTERQKCEYLSEHTCFPVLMLVGLPDFKNYNAVEKLPYIVPPISFDMDYTLVNYYLDDEHRFPCSNYLPEEPEYYDQLYHDAVTAARSARFEFGEIPNTSRR